MASNSNSANWISALSGVTLFLFAVLVSSATTAPTKSTPTFQGRSFAGQVTPPRPPGPRLGPKHRGPSGPATRLPSGTFDVLAPDERFKGVGFTSNPSPNLYWFVGRIHYSDASLKLYDRSDRRMAIDVQLARSTISGIQRVLTSQLKPTLLNADKEYLWWIALKLPDGSTEEAGSAIAYKPLTSAMRPEQHCGSSVLCNAEAYARMGYWYDAISTLSPDGRIPIDPAERNLFEKLLQEIGFPTIPTP